MYEKERIRVKFFRCESFFFSNSGMNGTAAFEQLDIFFRNLCSNICAEITIRYEQDIFIFDCFFSFFICWLSKWTYLFISQ